jgi:signal transduction histidine kinase
VLAAIPWLLWLVRGDDGPTWTFLALALAPIAALGAGQWYVDDLALGSEIAYALLAFPSLLLVVLGVAFAPVRVAVGYAVAPYAAYGLPGIAALATDRGMGAPQLAMWHVAFVLSLVAGYAVRYSYHANRDITAAREALAWQAAADERRQVARDVHDVVAHTLAVTMLHMTAARMAVQREAPWRRWRRPNGRDGPASPTSVASFASSAPMTQRGLPVRPRPGSTTSMRWSRRTARLACRWRCR